MRLLGNSIHGLPPHHKCTLYQTCIIPLATYGFCLWYFTNLKCSKNLKMLQSLQQMVALWITGAFRTSPTGGTESLAGLIPLPLHLSKLAKYSAYQYATLNKSHPIFSLLSAPNSKGALPHPCSIDVLSTKNIQITSGLVVEADRSLFKLNEKFSQFYESNHPGFHILDNFSDYFSFFNYNRSNLEKLGIYFQRLDASLQSIHTSPDKVIVIVDGFIPPSITHSAIASY
ncbi:hypothetical protein AN958_01744 [Leucoagaricus sp. SymC.cos]|nr:hypothetical protein AN958_01744 [Leucoagaricus sp. SymC.cos]